MTKAEYLAALQSLYRVANMSDSDNPAKVDWLDADASSHQCRPMDTMLHNLVDNGIITSEERDEFFNTL